MCLLLFGESLEFWGRLVLLDLSSDSGTSLDNFGVGFSTGVNAFALQHWVICNRRIQRLESSVSIVLERQFCCGL